MSSLSDSVPGDPRPLRNTPITGPVIRETANPTLPTEETAPSALSDDLGNRLITIGELGVELVEATASDLSVVNAARVSFAKCHDKMEEGDDKLIAYLLRHRHGTPFEHNFFSFRVSCPIFVVREWHRHRVGHSYNEMSGRYTELPGKFYVPVISDVRIQTGKPGHYEYLPADPALAEWYINRLCEAYTDDWKFYQECLERGIAKELARIHLPVGIFTEFIWSCNARSLMHFLGLRNAPNAMREIRYCAEEAEQIFIETMPITAQAFIENGRVAP